MANEQLRFTLPTSPEDYIPPFSFAYSEFKASLVGRLIRIVHEVAGKPQAEIEEVLFTDVTGKLYTALEFHRPESGDPRTIGTYAFASPSYGISKIFLADNEAVIYENSAIRDYYRTHSSIPPDIRTDLFLQGRWFPPAPPGTGE